jgi:hypothetical protein
MSKRLDTNRLTAAGERNWLKRFTKLRAPALASCLGLYRQDAEFWGHLT